MSDRIVYEILKDGTVKWQIDGEISEANHTKASEFLQAIARRLGGEVVVEHTHPEHHHEQVETVDEYERQA